MTFQRVVIIFNPNSTGDSERNARDLKTTLESEGFSGHVECIGTEFAGHAEEIAQRNAADSGVLIVSSSGDGGYNEVVNGVLAVNGAAAVAVLPSGNANDHATSLHTDEFVQHIVQGSAVMIDCMRVSATVLGKPWQRYAHSYVGFGMTPSIGKLLTQKRPSALVEKWYVLRHVLSFRHVTLQYENRRTRFTNIVMATIPRMSKVIQLDESSSVTDARMEVYETRYVSKLKALLTFIGIGLAGIASERSVRALELETVRPTLIQLDGEVEKIDGQANVQIECCGQLLRTVI